MDVKEKISSTVEKLDDKTIYYILGGILLVVFLLDYFVLMRPQLATLTKINPEIKKLSDDISRAKTDIQRLPQYKKQMAGLEAKIADENGKMELREEVPLILEHLSQIALKHDVKINQIMPNNIDSEIILENEDRVYYSMPIEIEARAGYHNFGKFIDAVEKGGIFLKVKTMMVASSGDKREHVIKLTLESIVYEEL